MASSFISLSSCTYSWPTFVCVFINVVYANTISVILPMNIMCVFYLCIARKIRETSLIRQYLELHGRNFIVIRRILLFNIIILNILSIPCGVLYVISIIENHYGSIIYRVQWISSSIILMHTSTGQHTITRFLKIK